MAQEKVDQDGKKLNLFERGVWIWKFKEPKRDMKVEQLYNSESQDGITSMGEEKFSSTLLSSFCWPIIKLAQNTLRGEKASLISFEWEPHADTRGSKRVRQ